MRRPPQYPRDIQQQNERANSAIDDTTSSRNQQDATQCSTQDAVSRVSLLFLQTEKGHACALGTTGCRRNMLVPAFLHRVSPKPTDPFNGTGNKERADVPQFVAGSEGSIYLQLPTARDCHLARSSLRCPRLEALPRFARQWCLVPSSLRAGSAVAAAPNVPSALQTRCEFL